MRFAIASILDIYVGRFLIKCVSLIPPYPTKLSKDTAIKNLLVMKFWGFGSILEATPLLRRLKQHYPDAKVDLLTFSENGQVTEQLNLFGKVHTIDLKKGFMSLFRQTIQFIFQNRRQYSMIIDLEFFAMYSAFLTKMMGSAYSLGFDSFWNSRNHCYSKTVVFDHSNHIRLIFLKFLDALQIPPDNDITLSSPSISDEKKMSVMDKFPALKNAQLKIAVNINTSELSYNRRWPEEHFRKLISLVQQSYPDLQIYLVGGKADVPFVNSFYESLPDKRGIILAAGKLDILEFSHALSYMKFLVTSDGGPLHIAEAVGIPVVSFFGPETHRLYGPLSDWSLVFSENIYCSPCINTYNHKRTNCRDNQCLKLIKPEDVFEKIRIQYFGQANEKKIDKYSH